jgi:protein involved in polysaccharide export with SLBB domain
MRLNTCKRVVLTFCIAFAAQVFAQGTPQSQTSTVQRIAPENVLAIQVNDVPEFSRSLRVTASGDIRLPMLKDVLHVGGLLPTEAEKLIRDALMRERLVVDPSVSVTVSTR